MKKILVLGSGMVGSAIAIDMAQRHQVMIADIHQPALSKTLDRYAIQKKQSSRQHWENEEQDDKTMLQDEKNLSRRDKSMLQHSGTLSAQLLDVTDTDALRALLLPSGRKTHRETTGRPQAFDLVISAVPGFLGYQTLKTVIECGTDIVDISFFPENALDLDSLAIRHDVTAIVDCGVAPGMGNILLGYHDARMKVTSFECLVGGLPVARRWPFSYKAPFSPVDVIEEYTRPARYVENGCLVTRDALSDPELIDFPGIGTLEAFNTDGLRSLIHTMPHIPNMKEKTLRYPGHIEYIRVLKESGFFGTDPVRLVDGSKVRPLDLTSRLLFDQWRLGEDEEEFTVMRVIVEGLERVDAGGSASGDSGPDYSTETGKRQASASTSSDGSASETTASDTAPHDNTTSNSDTQSPAAPITAANDSADPSAPDPATLPASSTSFGKLRKRVVYELLDRYCPLTRTSSMARTTGYTATAAAHLLLDRQFTRKGVHPPENIGRDESCFRFMMDYLAKRGIRYHKKTD